MLIRQVEGALEGRAAAELERHLAVCERCREEFESLRDASAVFSASREPAPEPPADLWARVSSAIEREAPPVRRRTPGWTRAGLASAGAAAVLAMVAFAVYQPMHRTWQTEEDVEAKAPRQSSAVSPARAPRPAPPAAVRLAVRKSAPPAAKRVLVPVPQARPSVRVASAIPAPRPAVPRSRTFAGIPVARPVENVKMDGAEAPAPLHSVSTTRTADKAIGVAVTGGHSVYGMEESGQSRMVRHGAEAPKDMTPDGAGYHIFSTDAAAAPSAPASAAGTRPTEAKSLAEAAVAADRISVTLGYARQDGEESGSTDDLERRASAVEMVYSSPDAKARTIFRY